MKIMIFFLLFILSTSSWACILAKGEIKVNQDKLTIHQKFAPGTSYPFRTDNYLIHIKLLNSKNDTKQTAELMIYHPKTHKVLGQQQIKLEEKKNTQSSFTGSDGLIITTNLTYLHI